MRTLALTVAALCLSVSPAFADVAPPNTYGCQGKAAGDVCKDDMGKDATCKADICTGLDYANWDQDVRSSPPTKTYDCLKCEGVAEADTTVGTDTTTEGTDAVIGGADVTQTGGNVTVAEESSGCVAGPSAARVWAPWALLAVVTALGVGLLRRRRGV
jgi:hypothetical protein